MSFVLDFLKLRRPVLNYISPPVCEILFSSTGVIIGLDPFVTRVVTGLALGGGGDGGSLIWDTEPDDVCFNVYKESAVPGVYDLILECVPGPDIPVPDPPGCYKVSAVTPSGETDLSAPLCIAGVPPTVLTLPASDVQSSSAILEGLVNPMGFPASVFFQWGTTAAYGNSTPASPAGSGSANLPFDDLISGLTQNTTYHYRAAATNGAVTIVGLDAQFTTTGGGDGGGGLSGWVVQTRFDGDTLAPGCTGVRNLISADGFLGPWPDDPTNYTFSNTGLVFEMSLESNSNQDQVNSFLDSLCPGWVCGMASAGNFYSSTIIGPFAEDRTITATVEGTLSGSPWRDFDDDAGCAPVTMPGLSGILAYLVVTGIGVVASNSAQSPPNGSSAYSFQLSYLLPAGGSAYVNGILRTQGPGTTSTIKVTLAVVL